MKHLKYIVILVLFGTLAACDLLKETEVRGTLKLNPKSGWNELEFTDYKAKTKFQLVNGDYSFEFVSQWNPWADGLIRIKETNSGKVVGHLTIPKKAIKEDGTFEMYVNSEKNTNSFNMLGGRRIIVLKRERYVKLRQGCVYQESYSCSSTDSKGKTVSSTCSRLVSGVQDELWERRQEKSFYRILFDGGDLVNVADFSGTSNVRQVDQEIKETTCR
jgi:hypothetical protein